MRVFDGKPWPGKVNYVDDANKVVGFDSEQSCCENFGHGVFQVIPESTDVSQYDVNIEPYRFVDAPPTPCLVSSDCGGGLAWRIVAPGLPDLFVVIWNHHNGYYSHGFKAWNKEGSL